MSRVKVVFALLMTMIISGSIAAQEVVSTQPKNPVVVGHGKITIFGEVHQHHNKDFSDDGGSTFRNKKARIGVKGNVNDYAYIDDDANTRLTIDTNLFIDKKYTKVQFNYLINGEEGTSVDNNAFAANIQVVL